MTSHVLVQAAMIVKLYITLIFFPLAIFATQGLKNAHVDLDWLKRDHGPPPDEVFLEAWQIIGAQVTHLNYDPQY
jgi:hypothetical protein